MTQLKDYSTENKMTFNTFLSKVFTFVFVGLALTSVVAFVTSLFIVQHYELFASISLFIFIAQFVVVVYFSSRIMKMSKTSAWICYLFYSFTMGITFATLPLIYDGGSIVFAVIVTTVIFGCMAFIGHTTKVDLSKYSSIFFFGLLATIVVTFINMFIGSSGLDMIVNYAVVILFLGLIAYDMQAMRNLYLAGMDDSQMYDKMMILGAFELYTDFLNLFLRILAIFGNSRDN